MSNDYLLSSKVTDYGNGVYYFSTTGFDFARCLSLFIKEHPNLKLSAMAANGAGYRGIDKGYFVVFRKH